MTVIVQLKCAISNSSAGHETTHRNMEIGRDQSETKETVSQVVGVEQSVIWI